MKRSKFSDQQIAFILRQAEEGTRVEEVCRKAGISQQTYYRWRKKYGGLMPSEMRRLKQLEEANVRLKRLVADLSLDKEMLQVFAQIPSLNHQVFESNHSVNEMTDLVVHSETAEGVLNRNGTRYEHGASTAVSTDNSNCLYLREQWPT